jgi:hypothetical protein
LVNSDEIKIFEPGDYIGHKEPNSVHIVTGFDWTVTENDDIHFITHVRSTDTKRSDYQEVSIHAFKPANAENFTITTDFTGADSIYTSGDSIFIIGLKNGYPFVEKGKGGTNDFEVVYQQTSGVKFDHGTIHIENGKAYYYLMKKGAGNALPLYLQVIDLGV